MTVNEFKTHIIFIGFKNEILGVDYSDGDTVITILRSYNAIRLDNYAKRKSLFMSLDNPNIIERLVNFIDYETLILKKNK